MEGAGLLTVGTTSVRPPVRIVPAVAEYVPFNMLWICFRNTAPSELDS